MSISIRTHRYALATCGRIGCFTTHTWDCSSEHDAIDYLRAKGWHVTDKKALCPKCAPIAEGASA